VIAPTKGQHSRAPAGEHRGLHRRLHGVRPRQPEQRDIQPVRRHPGEPLEQRDAGVVRPCVARRVGEQRSLTRRGRDHLRAGVAQQRHAEPARQVDEHVAIHVAHVGAARRCPHDRVVVCRAQRHRPPGPARGDRRALVSGEHVHPRPRARAGQRPSHMREQRAEGGRHHGHLRVKTNRSWRPPPERPAGATQKRRVPTPLPTAPHPGCWTARAAAAAPRARSGARARVTAPSPCPPRTRCGTRRRRARSGG
jgi:hypothetical protein